MNLQEEAKYYKEVTGLDVCLSCPGSIKEMFSKLKEINNMADFRLKTDKTYIIKRGASLVINNQIITNDLSVSFLNQKPERILLFEKYPDNWEELIKDCNCKESKEDCKECEKDALMKKSVKELKQKYPDIKYNSKQGKEFFVNNILSNEV